MRSRYWSNCKLSNIIRGTVKPHSGTSKEWKEWEKAAAAAHPFRYWLVEEGLDAMQDLVNWPVDKLDSFSYWVYNRFIDKAWATDTGLDKNTWHETDEKILYGMFAELTNFVEVQLASRNTNPARKKIRDYLPYFIYKFIPYRDWQSGIEHLIWEVSLKWDHSWYGYNSDDQVPQEHKDDEKWMTPTPQAEKALEVMELYTWWKYIRPMREDPMDASGYSEYFDSLRDEGKDLFDFDDETPEQREWQEAASNMCQALEERYDEIDTEMMKKLIDIRRGLWT